MFRKVEKRPIILIILYFVFSDLDYLDKKRQHLIELILLILGSIFIVAAPAAGVILLFILFWIRGPRLKKYIKQYEDTPGVGDS